MYSVFRCLSCFDPQFGFTWRTAPVLLAFVVLLVSAPAPVLAIGDHRAVQLETLPSITAAHLTTHVDSETVLSKSQVQFSPAGMRLLHSQDGNKLELVQSFVTGQVWLVDRQRSIKHELEMTAMEDSDLTADDVVEHVSGRPQPGLLSAEPCIDLEAREIGASSWRGQAVSVWHCLDRSGQVYTRQFFSLMWNVVIREQGIDGMVDELRNIKNANFSVNHFIPEKILRQTDLRELLLGTPEIERYSGDQHE